LFYPLKLSDVPTGELLAEIARRLRAVEQPHSPLVTPLRGSAARAAKFIDENAGELGKTIADAIGVTDYTFRRHIWPKLRDRGYYNERGFLGGYFRPHHRCVATSPAT
jgi:hypothetical protein